MAKRNYPEEDLQIACVRWFNFAHPKIWIYHSPNGGFRNKFEAARFKKMGVRPGVADLCLLYDGTAHFFELKSKDGRLTAEQKAFGEYCLANGFSWVIIRSFDEFKETVERILK